MALGVPSVKAGYEKVLKRGPKPSEPPQIGRDGKWRLNLYDPNFHSRGTDGTQARAEAVLLTDSVLTRFPSLDPLGLKSNKSACVHNESLPWQFPVICYRSLVVLRKLVSALIIMIALTAI